ncbi:EAL and HDOD domain-containing protein [Lacimicrobium alkaliphilum]|uniref:Diguanylate phosphodiesterase n=1 Tax=Lacimicrobium alkaliphilum TaxID=1526571 RepID=A0A0U2ZF30_9ALTE|nr:HDOD domain-containing protein [Lacimicrobium alkaliphilum]ALS97735.1 diguanylate phosphodiesterase [Lacimicrobium alkaliphilum]
MAFFAARQPILNREKQLVAYELLFRDSLENVFPDVCDEQATSKMIEGLQFNLGMDKLTEDKLAFINFTQDTLLNGYPMLLPKEFVVVEILETVTPSRKLLEACKELKQHGYTIALDDYEHKGVWKHFYPYTDIIKIDYQVTQVDEIRLIKDAIKDFPHIKLLAEKVETHNEYHQAMELGFEYFQGYFFSKPEVMRSRTLDPSQMTVAQLMSALAEPEPDIPAITEVFQGDVHLSVKLLRYAQSPIFKRRNEISNIKQAIVLLGLQELRRFVSVLFTAQFVDRKPPALTVMSLVRARFCELISTMPGEQATENAAFLTGLLSLLEGMLDAPLAELLDNLPISQVIKDALIKGEGRLAEYLLLIEAFEQASWQSAKKQCNRMGVNIDKVTRHYLDAVRWATLRESAG